MVGGIKKIIKYPMCGGYRKGNVDKRAKQSRVGFKRTRNSRNW